MEKEIVSIEELKRVVANQNRKILIISLVHHFVIILIFTLDVYYQFLNILFLIIFATFNMMFVFGFYEYLLDDYSVTSTELKNKMLKHELRLIYAGMSNKPKICEFESNQYMISDYKHPVLLKPYHIFVYLAIYLIFPLIGYLFLSSIQSKPAVFWMSAIYFFFVLKFVRELLQSFFRISFFA